MKTFLFIPPVNDSLGELKPWEWVLLFCSFVASLALFALGMLMLANHVMWVWWVLVGCAFTVAKFPMQLYAQNHKGRWVGKVFLIIVVGSVLYVGRNRIDSHFSEIILLTILVVLLALCWATYLVQFETAKVNEQSLRRLDALQEQINSIESKVDHLKRTI
jgi:hypothetical protein